MARLKKFKVDVDRAVADVGRPRTPEDVEDLKAARRPEGECGVDRPWYMRIGPGLITGAADDDPSGIGTYSAAGAAFGYGQLWLVPFSVPMMIAVQEMCARIGLVTGKGIAAIIKEHYPKWLLYSTLVLLFGANTLNIYADLNVMAASAKMLFGLPQWVWLCLMTAVTILAPIMVSYQAYARVLKYLCLGFIGYIVVAVMPGVHNDWPKIAHGLFIPGWSYKTDYILGAVAFLGTTISPYLFYWQAGETVEEVVAEGDTDTPGERKTRIRDYEIRNARADTVFGMVASQVIAFFIMVATAGTLHLSGKTDINTAQDAALALKPLGASAYWIFSAAMIGSGLVAIPTLAGSAAYAASETLGWRYGLYRRFSRARAFYLTVAAVTFVGFVLNFFATISPIKALVYSAVVNAVVAVPLMFVLLLICNNRRIIGKRGNGPWSNVFGAAGVLFMGAGSVFLIFALVTGKAS
jgi:NRAMP (natural resistance-associated macrophage protein)-like metal ion transporter